VSGPQEVVHRQIGDAIRIAFASVNMKNDPPRELASSVVAISYSSG
jgi:hypothetical protein